MSSSSLLLSSPAEIQFAIMERCKGEDLFSATSTCSHLKKVCNQDRLWKLICKREFGLTSDQVRKPSLDNMCWKCYYQERKVLENKDAIKWHSLAESDSRREPKARYAHSATAANGQIFVIGGEIRSESRYNDIHVFDPATMTFSKALNHVIPQPLSRHQSCAVGNKIYVFGGFDGVSRFNEMSVFNVAMNWWYRVETRGDVPAPRSNHACAVVGTNIYLFGGNNTSPEGRYRVLDDFYCFDTMTLTWKCLTASKCGDFPTSRSGHALVPFGNKLLLFGGGVWDDGSAQWVHKYNHVYLYDTVHGDWQRADTRGDVTVCTFPSTARLGHYHLLVFGGQSTKNNWTTNELFVLDTVSMTWKDFNRDDRPLCRDMATLSYFRSRVNPMADKNSPDRFFDEPRPYYILFGGNHGGPVNDSLLLVVDKRISDPTDVQPTVHNCATSVM